MRKKDWLAIVSLLALCVFGPMGCGGGGSSPDGGSEEEAALAFTECMRAHGVDVEDPKPGQKNIELPDTSDPTGRKALAACTGKLGTAGQELSSGEDEEFREGALELAQCLRDQGIEMGDPEFLGPGKFHLDISGVDTNSPAFKSAQEVCSQKLPELPGISVGG